MRIMLSIYCFFFNDTATTEIYTLSLHDALPISGRGDAAGQELPLQRVADLLPQQPRGAGADGAGQRHREPERGRRQDRKSTRLNSSHANISYAVFCLKKKKHTTIPIATSSPSPT